MVLVYPEGRIGLDPGMWPERGKTGAARLALASGAPVVPVAQWGAHEVLPYSAPRRACWPGIGRALGAAPAGGPGALRHRRSTCPASTPGVPGAAQRATERIIDALTDTLVPLRPDEPDLPRYVDPTRPVEHPHAATGRRHRAELGSRPPVRSGRPRGRR